MLIKIKGYLALPLFLLFAQNASNFDREEIENIVESAKKGKEEAFESLYKVYSDNIYRYLYYLLGNQDTAYDLTSQTFLKAYENLKSYRFKGYSFSAWLYKIAHNLAIDHFRKQQKEASGFSEGSLRSAWAKAGETNFEELVINRVTLEDALKNLTLGQRQVIILKFIEQMNNSQVAEILGKTTGAVKAIERRALSELKNILIRQSVPRHQKEEVYAGK